MAALPTTSPRRLELLRAILVVLGRIEDWLRAKT